MDAADAWAVYYAKLATLAKSPRWNRDFLEQATVEVMLIKQQVAHTRTKNIKQVEVIDALRNLNKGQTADLKAEHFQAPSNQLSSPLSLLFMEMIQTGHTANVMETSKKVLIPKRGRMIY